MITFTPRDDFAALLVRGTIDLEAWREARGKETEPPWPESVGDQLEQMKRSRAVTGVNLKSHDASLRLAAVAIVAEHWLAGRMFAQDILQMAFDDPESAIRGAALTALQLHAQFIADPTRTLRKLFAELFPPIPRRTHAEPFLRDMSERCVRKSLGEKRSTDAAKILKSREGAESYLVYSDPIVRRLALFALRYYWLPDERLAKVCEKLLSEDRDMQVRSHAVSCLADYYAGKNNPRVEQLIAWIVLDTCEPREIRIAAYQCLFRISGTRSPQVLSNKEVDAFHVPDDIDWAFVKSFFRVKKKGDLPHGYL